MKRRYRIGIVVGLVLLLIELAYLAFRPIEPTYEGRRISLVINDWAAGGESNVDLDKALSELGTNALPFVVRSLARNDSAWHKNYRNSWRKLPRFLQRIVPQPEPAIEPLFGLRAMESVKHLTIPPLLPLLKHKSSTVREVAHIELGILLYRAFETNRALLALPLAEAMNDPEFQVRSAAASTLWTLCRIDSDAVLVLASVVTNSDFRSQNDSAINMQVMAASGLGRIDPYDARIALPALKMALHSTNLLLRGQAAYAIWHIDEEAGPALPVLLQAMPLADEYTKLYWIDAFADMGHHARAAIPLLTQELKQNHPSRVLDSITNAILRIGIPPPSTSPL